MSELPERKVLKEILLKLKTKTITSQERYNLAAKEVNSIFKGVSERAIKRGGPLPPKEELILLTTLDDAVKMFIINTYGVLEDIRLYIEALEHYCAELDKTLWDAIEQAKKEAEEQIKKQEELMKRKSPESYIK